jgi:hypothetical protein
MLIFWSVTFDAAWTGERKKDITANADKTIVAMVFDFNLFIATSFCHLIAIFRPNLLSF